MSEPQFIRNKDPHQVTMPEGSHVAASKSADVGGPSVRNTLIDEEVNITEAVDPLLNLTYEIPDPVKKLGDFKLEKKDDLPKVAKVDEPVPIEPEPTFSTEYIEAEMNFPARLIHIKIENDRVKSEIDELDKLMSSGI
jgi:hypothetical protein